MTTTKNTAKKTSVSARMLVVLIAMGAAVLWLALQTSEDDFML
jgi:hypothetical protein